MTYDLARGLRDLSDEPSVPDEAVALMTVRSRVRRARAVRTAGVGAASAAAAVALAVAVQAAPFLDTPTPPADPTTPVVGPTPTPTPTPTTPDPVPTPVPPAPVQPSPTVEPSPSSAPAPTDRPLVVLTLDGRLVLLDPGTGEVREEVVTGLGAAPDAAVAVAPDGESAYVQIDAADGELPSIVKVSLLDGTTQDVASGWAPAISPDGATLAFLGPRPGTDPLATRGLTLFDLTTQSFRHLPDEQWCGDCERLLLEPTWSPDGRQIAVGRGSAAELDGIDVTVVDVATAQNLGDGRVLPTRREPEGSGRLTSVEDQVYLPDGRLAVLLRTVVTDAGAAGASADSVSVDVLEPTTGDVNVTVEGPAADGGRLSAARDGLALVTRHLVSGGTSNSSRLHVWSGTGGFRQIGEQVAGVGG